MENLLTPYYLDRIFPFFVFGYGAVMTFVLNSPQLIKLGDKVLPPSVQKQMEGHRYLAIICLVVGALWSLQSLWAY